MNKVKSEIRFCDDIGMFASDRSIKESCLWRTKFCTNCYNHKIHKRFREAMTAKDLRNEVYWDKLSGKRLKEDLKRKRRSTKRFRFQTRGETFANEYDVFKVLNILQENPDIDFWIPTRAWRNELLKDLLEVWIMPLPNSFLQASTDPTNTEAEWKSLKKSNWSIMFYGDDDMIRTPAGDLMHLCEKTFFGENGSCVTCKDGCFSKNQTVVHLKQH